MNVSHYIELNHEQFTDLESQWLRKAAKVIDDKEFEDYIKALGVEQIPIHDTTAWLSESVNSSPYKSQMMTSKAARHITFESCLFVESPLCSRSHSCQVTYINNVPQLYVTPEKLAV